MKYPTAIFGLMAVLWLAGCGQKGDLYKTVDKPPQKMEETTDKKAAE